MKSLVAAALFLSSGLSHAFNGLCEKDEFTYFSCKASKKVISLCASTDLGPKFGYLQYRFGIPNKVELEYPTTKAHPNGLFFESSAVYSGGIDNHLSFTNGAYKYVVYSTLTALGAPTWEHEVESGVAILKSGKLFKDIPCSRPEDFRKAYPDGVFQKEELEFLGQDSR